MPGRYYAQLVECLPSVIENLNSEFDSHAFIGELVKQQPHLYIETLFYDYFSKSDPFRMLHSDLARELTKKNHLAIQQNEKEPSSNIHFKKTDVELWRRA